MILKNLKIIFRNSQQSLKSIFKGDCLKSTASENQFLEALKITYFTIGGIVAVFQTAPKN